MLQVLDNAPPANTLTAPATQLAVSQPSGTLPTSPLSSVAGANPEIVNRLAMGMPLIHARGNSSLAYRAAKRAMDIAGASVLIVLLSPLMLVTFLTLLVTTKGRPLFFQERIGHRGLKFRMWKFRTMCIDADNKQHLVRNEKDGPIFKNRQDPRITKLGRILRGFSIDETPQLFSVLLGDMALVGPRPPVAKEVVKYRPDQLGRLSIKPGLTCLWQVSGRSEIGFEDWVQMDLWYAENQNLWTDLSLLFRTPYSVLSRRGAY